ncbi:MAG: divalent-cation tolerance protein CutA [Desulfobacter sp.]|nr:divalent-cation tolerance protein CutA [Desulfobacter sp.]
MTHIMVLVTCSTQPRADGLAQAVIEKKLAACVQIHPVTSLYTWKNQIHKDAEYRLIIKTRSTLYPELETFIREQHEYEVPQIVQVPIKKGLTAYLNWIDQSTK